MTRDGGLPLTWRAYPGDRPDVTQFPDMIDQLKDRYEAVCAAAGRCGGRGDDRRVRRRAELRGELRALRPGGAALHGSVPASDCPDLTTLPASRRAVVDKDRFGGLTAYDTRRVVYGAGRRAILTHSPQLRDSQARGFDGTTLAKAGKKLDELAATLARGKTRRAREKVQAEIEQITSKPWVRRVIRWQLDGDQPKDLRLTWHVDPDARAALEEEIFGKHVLITSHDDWPAAEVIAGYRSQSEAEFSFRQLKDPHVVSFSPMHHWTEHNIRVHVFTCVLALQLAHLMRYRARQAGLDMSVRELLGQLAAIGETVLIYPSTGGRPKARRMTTEVTGHQPQLSDVFSLARWAPQKFRSYAKNSLSAPLTSGNPYRGARSSESPASITKLVEAPPSAEAAANPTRPMISIRRRPTRSDSRPPSSSSPPKASEYAVTTHCRSALENTRSRWAEGSAMFTIVASSTTISWASPATPRIHQHRAGPAATPDGPARSDTATTVGSLIPGAYVRRRRLRKACRAGP